MNNQNQKLYIDAKKRTIPLAGKIPITKDWVNSPYSSKTIEGNYGWALDSGDLILDIDPRNGGKESLTKLSKDLSLDIESLAALKVISGSGGLHLYFKKDPKQAVRKKLSEYPGIDFLSFGSQVVCPGSIHPETKQSYKLDDACLDKDFSAVSYAPKVLIEKLVRSEDFEWSSGEGLENYDDGVGNVKRFNKYLVGVGPCEDIDDVSAFRIALKAKDFGLSPAKALQCMIKWDAQNTPPWGEATLRFKIGNAYRYGKRELGEDNAAAVFEVIDEQEEQYKTDFAELMGEVTETTVSQSQYSAHCPTNARVFLARKYPNQTLRCRFGDLYGYTGQVWQPINRDEIAAEIHLDMEYTSFNQNTINQTSKALFNKVYKEEFVIDPAKIAFENGVLDLKSPKFPVMLEFGQEHFVVGKHDYEFLPNVECPRWEKFLMEVFDNDKERIDLLQEWMGYNLIFDAKYQKIMLMIGVSRSGKGTISRILKRLVGQDMFAGISLTTLTESFGLQSLLGRKTAVIADAHNAPKGLQNRAKELLLNISGCDTVMVNRKFLEPLSIQLKSRLTMIANEVPSFSDGSDALSNRFLVLPFRRSFAGAEDVNLDADLDKEISGIFNWALIGLQRLCKNQSWTHCEEGAQELRSIRALTNPVADFVEQCVVCKKGTSVESDALYKSFCEHMDLCGRQPYSKQRFFSLFSPLLMRKGVRKIRKRNKAGDRQYFYENCHLLVNTFDEIVQEMSEEELKLFA